MSLEHIFSPTGISASGLAAERTRMEVIANNIANANTTRGPNGEPYRRKDVVFSTALQKATSIANADANAGVEIVSIADDQSEFPRVYQPGHPDADADGFVRMPNVKMANEMVDLISANRGYEANLRVIRSFREMVQQALSLLSRR